MRASLSLAEVHPAVRRDIANIDEQIAHPSGILNDYPEICAALLAQRDFIALRPQIAAFNSENGPKSVKVLMRDEGWEVVDAIAQALWHGEVVNGKVSEEADDWIIFAAQYGAMLALDGKKIGLLSRAEIALGMAALRSLIKRFPHFNYLAGLPIKVKDNGDNYPVRVMQAPREWGKPQIAQLHGGEMRPAMKRLRKQMPGGVTKLHPDVTLALENLDPIAPTIINGGPEYIERYNHVITLAHKYEM